MNSNRNRIAALAAAIVAATVVAWIVHGTNARVGDGIEQTSVQTAREEARQAVGLGATSNSSVEGATARASASHSIDAADAQDESTAVTIEIIRGDTLAPVPGARVLWWPAHVLELEIGGFESWLRRSAVEDHVAEALESHADERGIAKLHQAVHGGTVLATSDGMWGRATIEADQQNQITVLLAPDVDLRARVVDTRGAPVPGTTVALRQLGLSTHTDLLSARANADGIAVLRHVGSWWSAESSSTSGFVVAVPGLFDPPCERVLDRETLASGTIELVLEPSGSCVVELIDGLGRTLFTPFEARLCFADRSARNAAETACETIASGSKDGVVFEHVTLGRELSVAVTREGVHESSNARGTGPKQAGEVVYFRVQVQADTVNVAGRALDSTGAPLGGLTLSAQLETNDGKRHGEEAWSTRTNSNGQFTFELHASLAPSEDVLLALRAQNGTDKSRACARRALPRDLSPGSYDLGDITLEDAPLVAAGIVVDTEGHPVAEAVITALAPTAEPGDPGLEANSLPISGRSDSDGRFTLRGEAASDDIVVRAHNVGYVDRALLVRRGTQSVRLVLGPAASLTGKVLLDPSLKSSPVLVTAVLDRSQVVDSLAPTVEPTLLDKDGGFAVRDLSAGAYSVRVLYAATGCELGRVDAVIVESGRAKRDPRIDPLDLRATHRLIELELVDARGAPVRDGSCCSRAGDDPTAPTTVTRESAGRLRLLYAGHPLDVSVSATGFLHMELERVSASQRVTLLPAAKLRLELVRGLPALDPDLRLGASLTPVHVRPLSIPGAACTGTFDNRGVLVCETPFVGEMLVSLSVTATDARDPHVEYLNSTSPHTVDLVSDSMEQALRIDFDPNELARAIQAIRSDR